jgi:uncharacterized membrane protein
MVQQVITKQICQVQETSSIESEDTLDGRRLSKLAQAYQTLQFQLGKATRFVDRKALYFVIAFVCVYAAVFSGFTIYMYDAYATYAWDLGAYTQSLWTTINKGQFFYYTIELPVNPGGSFFGAHFSPILFLVLPIYAVFQSPLTLLVLQSVILALGAVPIYFIAKKHLGDRLSAVCLAAVYLTYPAIQCVNCFDFHTEAFIPLFFLLAFYYIDEKKWFKGLLFVLLTLSTIEFAPTLIIFLGAYLALKETFTKDPTERSKSLLKRMFFPALLIVIAIITFFLAFFVIDTLNPIKSTGLPGDWTYWGSSLSGVVLNILTHPGEALTYMVTPIDKVSYLSYLLGPLLVLPIFSPEFLLAVPWLIAALLSENAGYYNIYFQYSAFAIGQLFIAFIFSVKRLSLFGNDGRRNLKLQRTVLAFALVVTILFSVALSPIGLPEFSTRIVEITNHSTILDDVLKLVPNNASIATENDIFPHVAQRENAYIFTWPMPMEVEYILVDMTSGHFQWSQPYNVPPSEALPQMIATGGYGLLACADGILLFEKGYLGPPTLYVGRNEIYDASNLATLVGNSIVLNDPTSLSGKVIAHEETDSTGVIWYGPYAYFFSGEYQATFIMKTTSASLNCVIDVAASGTIVSQRTITASDFKSLGDWEQFTLDFNVTGLSQMEFRGYCESNNTYVALDYVRVTQTGL